MPMLMPMYSDLMGIRRVFVADPRDRDCANAVAGFKAYGVEIMDRAPKDEELNREGLYICGANTFAALTMRGVLEHRPWNDYPEPLRNYNGYNFFGREIWDTTWDELEEKERRVFVKMSANKSFSPGVMTFPVSKHLEENGELAWNSEHCNGNTPLLASEPVNFISEWRAFVVDGEVLDVRRYKGEWITFPSPHLVKEAAKALGKMYGSYGIDFGITDDGRCLVIEVNNGEALASYGLPPWEYANVLAYNWISRFKEKA